MKALDRLLRALRPPLPDLDADLARLGLSLDDPHDPLILRALAVNGSTTPAALAAWIGGEPDAPAAPDRVRQIQARLKVLRARGYVAAGRLDQAALALALAERMRGFAEMAEPAPGEPGPDPLDLRAGLAALAGLPAPTGPGQPGGPDLAAALGLPAPDAEVLAEAVAQRGPEAQALLAWLLPALGCPPVAAVWRHAVARIRAHARAALAAEPDDRAALEATLLPFLAAVADLLTPQRLTEQPARREELLRRWAWWAGVPVQTAAAPETRLRSGWRLARLDYRRILAEEEERAVSAEAQAIQARLIDEEKARRKAAAEAYASGRRE